MKNQTVIRAYNPSDKARLLEIWRAASQTGHPFFTTEQLDQQQQLVADVYIPNAENWVALVDNEIVGFIGLLDHHIGGLFVDPNKHKSGVGRSLVQHALALKGILELEVYALNKNADGFYRHIGFEEISRRPTDDNGLPFELIKLRIQA